MPDLLNIRQMTTIGPVARNRYVQSCQLAADGRKPLQNQPASPTWGHVEPGNSEVRSVNGPYSSPGGYGPPGGEPGGYGQPGGYGPPGGEPGGYGQPGGGMPGYPPQQDYNYQQGPRGYLQGGPVDFQGAIRQQFENVMNFN